MALSLDSMRTGRRWGGRSSFRSAGSGESGGSTSTAENTGSVTSVGVRLGGSASPAGMSTIPSSRAAAPPDRRRALISGAAAGCPVASR